MSQSRRFWTPEEDQALIKVVESMETTNWTLAGIKFSKLHPQSNRNSKQCRQRWMHHLKIANKSKNWTQQEEKALVQLFLVHHQDKNKWKTISEALTYNTARQPTDVKNRFYALIRRGLRRINNHIGRQICPQQIRILKPSTISLMLEKSSDQNSEELVKIIYKMATNPIEQKNQKQKYELSRLLKNIISFSEDKRLQQINKENQTQEIKDISKRKYSVETSPSSADLPKNDLKSSINTLYSSQQLYFPEHDIGCFLNIDQAESPVLEFEDFILQL